jgi:hypothetical protein
MPWKALPELQLEFEILQRSRCIAEIVSLDDLAREQFARLVVRRLSDGREPSSPDDLAQGVSEDLGPFSIRG